MTIPAQRCQVCNNLTTNPSGRCYLHENSASGKPQVSTKIGGLSIPSAGKVSIGNHWVSEEASLADQRMNALSAGSNFNAHAVKEAISITNQDDYEQFMDKHWDGPEEMWQDDGPLSYEAINRMRRLMNVEGQEDQAGARAFTNTGRTNDLQRREYSAGVSQKRDAIFADMYEAGISSLHYPGRGDNDWNTKGNFAPIAVSTNSAGWRSHPDDSGKTGITHGTLALRIEDGELHTLWTRQGRSAPKKETTPDAVPQDAWEAQRAIRWAEDNKDKIEEFQREADSFVEAINAKWEGYYQALEERHQDTPEWGSETSRNRA